MTVKEASKLRKGDRVGLTRDPRVWLVDWVHAYNYRAVEVCITAPDGGVLELNSAAGLRSLKRLNDDPR